MVHRLMEVLVSSGNNAELESAVIETVREYEADEVYCEIPFCYRGMIRTSGTVSWTRSTGKTAPGT